MKIKALSLVLLFALPFANNLAQAQRQKISLEDIVKHGTFRARNVYGLRSMNDGEHYSAYNADGQIARFAYATGNEEGIIFDPKAFDIEAVQKFSGYAFSPNEDKLLIETNINQIYRHSYTAENYVYDVNAKTLKPFSTAGPQLNAAFSPDGSKVAFVRDNNLYVVDLQQNTESQLTTDGKHNHIINGAADWVYEEEFALTTAFKWSPDSKRLAFYRFNEERVKLFNMTTFQNQLYPQNQTFKYPKCGEQNSIVSILVYDLESRKITKMDVGDEDDQYISRIKWTPNPQQLCIVRLNRLQNQVDVLIADAATGSSTVLYTESNKWYIPQTSDSYPLFTPDGKQFIITSEKNGYNHIYLYGIDGQQVAQLTTGTNEVIDLYGLDAASQTLYYRGFDGDPMHTAIYAVSLKNKKVRTVSPQRGTNFARFSKGFKYSVINHTSFTSPLTVSLFNKKGKLVRVMEDNAALRKRVEGYEMPTKEFFTFTTSQGVTLNGMIIKPFDFDPQKKYPVLMDQYSGPGSVTVVDRFTVSWDEYIASLGYLVVSVDPRGTAGRGEEFKKMTYRQLGLYESTDQIEAARYLQTLPYVQPDRIGIWGWSYGGYMSSLCLFKGHDVFRMAIAVAPVTNWRYYDSVYTERYMGLPQDNADGYDSNSPINHVEKLQGKLLIVHGTADDNVHYQNTLEMVTRLIAANKQFDFFTYPDKNHFIRGGNTSFHLYSMLTQYVKDNL